MTLKTYSNKINPAINFFKTSLKKQSGFVLLSLVISFLVCPGAILKNMSDNSYNIAKHNTYEIQGLLDSFTTLVFVISLAVMLLLLFVNFYRSIRALNFLYRNNLAYHLLGSTLISLVKMESINAMELWSS